MEAITLQIGAYQELSSGIAQQTLRDVQFIGEKLGTRDEYGFGRNGRYTDTRGTTQTLYRTEDNRLIVHLHAWSKWQGEPETATLQLVTETDLQAGGRFELLGYAAGYGRPLTLDQAMEAPSGFWQEEEPPFDAMEPDGEA